MKKKTKKQVIGTVALVIGSAMLGGLYSDVPTDSFNRIFHMIVSVVIIIVAIKILND